MDLLISQVQTSLIEYWLSTISKNLFIFLQAIMYVFVFELHIRSFLLSTEQMFSIQICVESIQSTIIHNGKVFTEVE